MPKTPKIPTDAELELLQRLWDRGPSTVRELHDAVSQDKQVAYTTVLKQLQVMTDKGFVERDVSSRSHVYRPLLEEQSTQRSLLRDLVRRVFRGSRPAMVMGALSDGEVSAEELAEMRRVLDELDS